MQLLFIASYTIILFIASYALNTINSSGDLMNFENISKMMGLVFINYFKIATNGNTINLVSFFYPFLYAFKYVNVIFG